MKRVIWYHLMDWYISATAIHIVGIVDQLVINQRKMLQVSLDERFCPTLSIFSQHYKLTDFASLNIAPGAWKEAWTLVGYCSGTIAPTKAPHFETLDAIEGGCPDGWDEDGEYDEGDLVAVVVSDGFEDTSDRTRKPSRQPVTPTPPPTSQYCFSPTSSPSKRPTKFPVCDLDLRNLWCVCI